LSVTDPALEAPPASAPERLEGVPRRWTLHGLNNGVIFNATCRGVEILPRPVSYAIGRVGTWLAWRVMDRTREAVADNLKALAPDATDRELERLALDTLRSYAKDVIDFLRALQVRGGNAGALFSYRDEDAQRIIQSRAQGRGIILVLGHYGNWEIGSVFMRRVLDLPLTVVAMAEANAEVNRIRHEIRRSLDIDTIEVRKSLDTALQLRRRLAENHVVAMLMDRHVGRDRVDVSLFGRRAGFLRTPAMMGYLTGAPLVPCFIERLGAARYSVETGEPIVVSRECPRDQAIESAAQRFADELAARITRRPHNWYHF
jgi:KDO2-lipid IV(A) lauroyltransferase